MIKNEQQYKIAKNHATNFKKALEEVDARVKHVGIHPVLGKAEKDALRFQYQELVNQIEAYEMLKSGQLGVIEISSFDELPRGLIQARIAKGLSQKDLADRLHMKEQQIQRYEATNYSTASMDRIKEVIKALEVKINKEIFISDALFTKSTFFKSLKNIGLEPAMVLKRIIPTELASKIENISSYSEEEAKNFLIQAISFVSRLFKIDATMFTKPDTIALGLLTASPVRYKKNVKADIKKISAYTIYAHTIALLILECCKDLPTKPVPSALAVRQALLKKHNAITLKSLLNFIWDLGIPVFPLKDSGTFHGACWRVEGKNVIVLKQKTISESRWIFDLSHELCHAGQNPNEDTFEIVEAEEDSIDNLTSQHELDANYYAGDLTLGDEADDLAIESILIAKQDLVKLKKSVVDVAKKKNVDPGILANYIAFRLQVEQNKNWWGTAMNLQTITSDPFEIAKEVLLERVNLDNINEHDRDLVLRALT
jgi:transcriptional regulator with XRE-family HTH domain/Zn-dependent peptidase ImmA (M78 family)